ncbi:MAG: VOC family protein, partial [Bradyrhizobium sp.]|nr:VOC family protein [Bradyrhizobium sp.]
TGEAVAFFDTGGTVLALYPWDALAHDAGVPDAPRPQAFRGVTLAWNCRSEAEVDAALASAGEKGANLLKSGQQTDYGGYSGYFADPDGHVWEVVTAPGIDVGEDDRVHLPA